MKNVIKMSLAAAILAGTGAVSAQAEGLNILSDVKLKGELRPRYQFTDSDASTDSAGSTFTNRTNLSVSAGLLEVEGLQATIELNAVNDFDTLDQQTHQTAAEKDVAKMSQAKITYTTGGLTAIVGRNTTNLDNQRFIGSVGWKQNFQTLDLAGVVYGDDMFNFTGVYVYGVNAIGDDGNGNEGIIYGGGTSSGETESVVLNGSAKVMDALKVTAYAYMLGSHSDTYGVALTGKPKLGDGLTLNYRAEYATFTDATLETKNAGKPDRDADYYNLELGMNMSGILAGINYEVLGEGKEGAVGAEAAGFQTALATKHKFNGWADMFLVTPDAGLVDANIMVGYKAKAFGVAKAIYHDFESDRGGNSYGQELDLIYKNKIPGLSNVNGMIKAAFFSEDDGIGGYEDMTKVWLMADYKFSI